MTTCQKRGDRSRKKMTGTAFMKGRWDTFLRNSQSKDSLILLISDCIKSRFFPGLKQKKMVTTYNEGIYSSDSTEPATLLHPITVKGTTGLLFTVKICQKRELTRQ